MGRYSIKDVEHLTGVKAHTIRIWEQRYGLVEPERSETNIRFYTDEQLKRIMNVALLNHHGIKISHILKMADHELHQKVQELQANVTDDNQSSNALLTHLLDLDEQGFEKTFNNLILKQGFEAAMSDYIFPFLKRIGILWSTDSISPVHEHFMSNIIRRKLMVATDAQKPEINASSKKFILFLPENEWHELGLMFAEYCLRKRNHDVIYLGASVPFHDLISLIGIQQPDYIFSVFSVEPSFSTVEQYLEKIKQQYPKLKICAAGPMVDKLQAESKDNIFYMNDIHHTISFFNRLSPKYN